MPPGRDDHPFRFGVSAIGLTSRQQVRDLAQRAEAGGWSTLLVADHLGALSSMAVALAAAEATTTLRVGTFVLNGDFHHALRLAQEAATLDLLSGGRLELGVGSGWNRAEYELLGVGYEPAAQRARRLAETVGTLKAAWAGAVVLPDGGEGRPACPPPVQSPHPPLLIGGHGDTILRLAATEADIVGLTGLTWTGAHLEPTGASLDALSERAGYVRRHAGPRGPSLELNVLVQSVAVGDPFDQQADRAAGGLGLPVGVLRDSPIALVGTVDEVVDKLLAVREATGISYFTVFSPALDDLGPVVERLAGT